MNRLYPLLLALLFFGCGNDTLNQKQTSLTPSQNAPQVYVAGSTVASGVPVNSAIQLEFYNWVLNSPENLARITLYHQETSSIVPIDYSVAVGQEYIVLITPQMHALSANSNYTLTVDASFTYDDNFTTVGQTFTYDFFTSATTDTTSPSITLENNVSAPFELQGSVKFRSNEPLNIHHASSLNYAFFKDSNTSVQVPAIPLAGPTMAMFTPAWPLEPNTSYTFGLPTLYDLANNPATGTLSASITTAPRFGVAQTFNDGVDFGMRVDQGISSTSIVFFDANRTLHVYRPDGQSADFNATEQNSSYFYDNNRTIYSLIVPGLDIFVFSKDENHSNGVIDIIDPNLVVNLVNVNDSFEQNATYAHMNSSYGCILKSDENLSSVHLYSVTYATGISLTPLSTLNIPSPQSCYINTSMNTLHVIATDYIYAYELNSSTLLSTNYVGYTPTQFIGTSTALYWIAGDSLYSANADLTTYTISYTQTGTNFTQLALYGNLAFLSDGSSKVWVLDISQIDAPHLISTLTTATNVTSLAVATHEYYTVNAYITAKALLVGHNDSIEQISLNGFGEAVPKITVPLSYKPAGLTIDVDGFPYIWHENLIEEYDANGSWIDTYVFDRTIRELIALDFYTDFIITHEAGLSTVKFDFNTSSIIPYDERNISNISAVTRNTLGKLYVGTSDGWLYTYSENNLTLTDENSTNIGKPITSLFPFETSLLVGTLDKNITIFNTDSNGTLTDINQTIATKDVPLDIKPICNGEMGCAIAVAEGFSGVEIFHDNLDFNFTYNHTVPTLGFANALEFYTFNDPQNDYRLTISDYTGLTHVLHSQSDDYDETIYRSLGGKKLRGLLFDTMYGDITHILTDEGLIIFDTFSEGEPAG